MNVYDATRFRAYAGATPTGGDAHVDVPLSNFASSAFSDQSADFIADRVFPEIGVGKQSDKYYVIERGEFWRIPVDDGTLRAPRSAPKRINFQVSSDSYYADNYALATDNAVEDLVNADRAIQLRQNSTRLITGVLRLDQEIRVANLVTSVSNVGSGVALTGTDKWNDSNSDPIAAVNTGHAFIRSRTGLVANAMVVDWDTMVVLRRHPALLDLYKYTAGGQITDEQLRSVFMVDEILVGRAVRENAAINVDTQTTSVTNVWGNNAILFHRGAETGLQSRILGARFRWRSPALPADFGVLTSPEMGAGQRKVEVQEVGYYQDEKVVAADLAYAITGTL